MNLNRRKFIKVSGLSIGASVFAVSCKITPPGYYFFTKEEADCVMAICEQIIPADEDPGATDAGAVNYIDNQLVKYHRSFQTLYRTGLSAIQKTSMQMYGASFEELDFKTQTEFLTQMEKGRLPDKSWGDVSQVQFFNILVSHTMQGFYCFPRHGGNRNYAGYYMLGLEVPQVIGRNVYS